MKTLFTTILFCVLFSNQPGAAEVVYFNSAVHPYTPFQLKQAKKNGKVLTPKEGIQLLGRLSRPTSNVRSPAVILLHGCGGIWSWNDIWMKRLSSWGYVVLDVDSLSPRGEWSVCRFGNKVSSTKRALDAHGAKLYLQALPYVDPTRIAIMGMSHGGWSTLAAISTNMLDGLEPFQAAVALYPSCEDYPDWSSPLLLLIGELDDWTPASDCKAAIENASSKEEIIFKVYPNTHHVFDIPGINLIELGHILQYNQESAEDAMELVKSFLAKYLQKSE